MPFYISKMKNNISLCLYFVLIFVFVGCNIDKESLSDKNDNLKNITKQNKNSIEKNDTSKTNQKKEEKDKKNNEKDEKKSNENVVSLAKKLYQELIKKGEVQFAPIDNQVISQDTAFKVKQDLYEINFATGCMNDSIVTQEMSDFTAKKSFILAHNYETNISFTINGKPSSKKTIHKELFKNKLENAFLEKSIIKHPQFVKFDETKNEAIFEFIIGVPNTDWLVIAAVNLNPQGSIRIVDIMMPDM
ncbi:MAG: DUF4738 domain-containing protein [Bacteroidetes bacterium]|nr:MAG: DUF4738 domain-containing protein [Bacteroidota bacterium]